MALIHHLEQAAIAGFLPILRAASADVTSFRRLASITVDGETRPLLIMGTAHAQIEDGHCAAVLNPDPELCDRLTAGQRMKEMVAGRCDAMVWVWINDYVGVEPVMRGASYVARRAAAPKFVVT